VIQLANFLTPSDIMLGLLAAAAHDVDHPGVNQPFLIKTKHHLASLYQVKTLTRLIVCTMVSVCISFSLSKQVNSKDVFDWHYVKGNFCFT